MSKKKKAEPETPINEVGSTEYWRQLARHVCPDEKDPWRNSELGLTLQEFAQIVGRNWTKLTTICHRADDKAVSFSVGFTLDRKEKPSEVSGKIGYAEKYGDSITATTPDPLQTDLPITRNPEDEGLTE